jgi:hypothetical protein
MPGRLRKAVPVYVETEVRKQSAQRLGLSGAWSLSFGVISRCNTSKNIPYAPLDRGAALRVELGGEHTTVAPDVGDHRHRERAGTGADVGDLHPGLESKHPRERKIRRRDRAGSSPP